MDIAEEKAALRRAALAARADAHAEAARSPDGAGRALTRALVDAVGLARGRVVAGYMPIRTEADPLDAMARLAGRNRICVPVVEGPGRPLRFREWRPGEVMIPGPFGAAVPQEGDWLVPEVVIVPLVAFDRAMTRLGYGGGFYDRTLAMLRAAGPVRAIGLAFAAQEVARIPAEPTDAPLDAVVTEAGPVEPLAPTGGLT